MLWPRIYKAFLTFKLGMFRKFGTIDLNYCFFYCQEWEKSNPTKISKMLKNKLYHDIKLTAKKGSHWIANYRISSTDSKLEAPYKDSVNHSETKRVENNKRL